MSRREAWFVHASAAAVGATGVVYAWMRYVAEPADPYALVNHPLQPTVQHAHVLAAPALVFAVGIVWTAHVLARLRSGFQRKRRTGLLLAVLLLPMVASGYLVQVSADELWRTVWIWAHGLTSGGWLVAYVWHQVLRG